MNLDDLNLSTITSHSSSVDIFKGDSSSLPFNSGWKYSDCLRVLSDKTGISNLPPNAQDLELELAKKPLDQDGMASSNCSFLDNDIKFDVQSTPFLVNFGETFETQSYMNSNKNNNDKENQTRSSIPPLPSKKHANKKAKAITPRSNDALINKENSSATKPKQNILVGAQFSTASFGNNNNNNDSAKKKERESLELNSSPLSEFLSQNDPQKQFQLTNVQNLHHIPEQEIEETPLNRTTCVPSHMRSTISFSQYSADKIHTHPMTTGSKGSRAKKSTGKTQSDSDWANHSSSSSSNNNNNNIPYQNLNNTNNENLSSTVRRLFMPCSSSFSQIPVQSQSYQQQRRLLGGSDSKYDSILAKVDSNRERKTYQEEIARKNRLSIPLNSNGQLGIDVSELLNASINFVPCEESLSGTTRIHNSSAAALDEFNNIINQRERLKLNYYSYLLEETELLNAKFAAYVGNTVAKEEAEFQLREYDGGEKLILTLRNQAKEISELKSRLEASEEKCGKLSQLVLLYKDHMVSMNNSNSSIVSAMKGIQDELSTIDLIFQFGEEPLDNKHSNFQSHSNLSSHKQSQQKLVEQIARIKEYVQGLERKLISVHHNNEEKLTFLTKRLQEGVLSRFGLDEEVNQFATDPIRELHDTIEQVISVMNEVERDAQQRIQEMKSASESEKTFFESQLQSLLEQFNRLSRQQVRLQDEIFNARVDGKRELYTRLEDSLKEGGVRVSECAEESLRVKTVLEQVGEQRRVIVNLMKVLDWLEMCVEVNVEGVLRVDETFCEEIPSNELRLWCKKFARNLRVSIAQHIKRSVERRVYLDSATAIALKSKVYANDFQGYFDGLFSAILTNQNSDNLIHRCNHNTSSWNPDITSF